MIRQDSREGIAGISAGKTPGTDCIMWFRGENAVEKNPTSLLVV